MKPPWKYLVDLMSRGRRQTERNLTSKLIELEAHLARLPQLGSPNATPVAPAQIDVDLKAVEPTSLENGDSEIKTQPVLVSELAVDSVQPLDANTDTLLPQVNVAPVTNAPSITTFDDPAVAVLSQPNGFLGDLADMEEEIRQLRRKLSEKLRLQNDQLRMMLERFDRS